MSSNFDRVERAFSLALILWVAFVVAVGGTAIWGLIQIIDILRVAFG